MNSTGTFARPKSIAVIAAFLFAATVIAVVVGFSLLFPNPLLEPLWRLNPAGAIFFRAIGRASGVFLLMVGLATLLSARGLLLGKTWAWWMAIMIFSIDACGGIISYFYIHDTLRTVIGIIVSSVFIVTLCRRNVRDYFSRSG